MKNQHTPGPWIAYNADGGRILKSWRVKGSDNLPVCKVLNDAQNPEMEFANAHLIAAAPEMFDSLQAIVDAFGDQDSLLIDQAKAALSKAKGESK